MSIDNSSNFMLLVKPASADCNLRCDYCFYLEHSKLYPSTTHHRMNDQILEKMIASYMATEQQQHIFCWQGGEPLVMGLDFFRRVTDLQQKHGRNGSIVANSLQTNATLVDKELADHFHRFQFLVGCSLDGPAPIHDRYRRSAQGDPSHSETMRGIELLRKAGVAVNILVLVTQANVHRAAEVYRYLTDHGFYHQQYIPCVEFDSKGNLEPFAIDGNQWGEFLCELFDIWYETGRYQVSIRDFDAIVNKMAFNQITMCRLDGNCCQYFVVEHNGDIYPCDFFVEKSLCLGNVLKTTWQEAGNNRRYIDFGKRKALWPLICNDCECLDLCQGDCLKFRVSGNNSTTDPSWLCAGWKKFHAHTDAKFNRGIFS